jgi:hypothetical protein
MAASRWDSVPATNPKSVHLPPAKTNAAIGQEDLAVCLYDAISLRLGTLRCR